jgi:phosphoenolpyruvate synthase/pyruvate phosphate dikinase
MNPSDREHKWVYGFAESSGAQKSLLGGKGAGMAEMMLAGLPVPPGFTITTEACNAYYANDRQFAEGMWTQTNTALAAVETQTNKRFGDPRNPLLVSVRSGAAISMPGMMDTVLNLGLNDQTVEGLAQLTHNRRFALDAYRRFIAMFGHIVMGVEASNFERVLERLKQRTRGGHDTDLTETHLAEVIDAYKRIIFAERHGESFPQEPHDQLRMAIAAVFDSWMGRRAVDYRRIHRIADDLGTAVNVQAMVFGNLGWESGTGVAFTRNPSTGERTFYGEYLLNAQGEDVVAGTRTPQPIQRLAQELPAVYAQLQEITGQLERHYRDMQDIEFTIEQGKLWMLQTRAGKRTGAAAVRIAVEMVAEGLIDQETALLRVEPGQLDQLLHRMVDPTADVTVLTTGLPASPGAAAGIVLLDPDEAEQLTATPGAPPYVLVRHETSPDDFHGMVGAQAVLTARGGMTCVAGETRILTDRGLLPAKAVFDLLAGGVVLQILSFDTQALQPVWRRIIATGCKPAEVITVAVSQTGHAQHNTLRLTADHKMFVIHNRQLVKKRLDAVLQDNDFLTIIDQLPLLHTEETCLPLAYTAGAILADGYIKLTPTKGAITFVQKATPAKAAFIDAVQDSFAQAFATDEFTYTRERETVAVLRGREIRGTVTDHISFRRAPAAYLTEIRNNLSAWVLTLDRPSLLSFLAGYADGDGTYAEASSTIRLQIVVARSKTHLLEGLALACLRLGIVPQITSNREDYYLQIAEQVDTILAYTRRLQAKIPARLYESKCLSIKGLFTDVVTQVNYMGCVREALKRNLMFGVGKIRRDLLPLCVGRLQGEVKRLLDSPLRSYRVKQVGGTEMTIVYNFEVEANNEQDKNYVAFSSRLTPILVSNSHAAVVARGMGKACVVGAGELEIDYNQGMVRVADALGAQVVRKGDWITVDGSTGRVLLGQVPTVEPQLGDDFQTLMGWADARRKLRVRANADTGADAAVARTFGAEGIGLCRTEHMFFGEERLVIMRQMILAESRATREQALEKLLPLQRQDFLEIMRAMDGLPVTIRLLDPPLHEFLPNRDDLVAEITELRFTVLQRAQSMAHVAQLMEQIWQKEAVLRQVDRLREANPMLGHRGCRLGLVYPEVTEMQVRAIFEAACTAHGAGVQVYPEIMVPLVMTAEELRHQREVIDRVAQVVMGAHGLTLPYSVGTMIELPRAALLADRIARHADFFSFGTNDLTQTTLGMSRDDSGRFLSHYILHKVLPEDPFQVLDEEGVGQLIAWGVQRGRTTQPGLKVGICGEHGGDAQSIAFCSAIGMDYVSCSPFRVPLARLAAAQVAIGNG